ENAVTLNKRSDRLKVRMLAAGHMSAHEIEDGGEASLREIEAHDLEKPPGGCLQRGGLIESHGFRQALIFASAPFIERSIPALRADTRMALVVFVSGQAAEMSGFKKDLRPVISEISAAAAFDFSNRPQMGGSQRMGSGSDRDVIL